MRIITGKHRGRKIEIGAEHSKTIRPTSDYAREAIFNILSHGKLGIEGSAVQEARVLDLYCGTGALGLEALSRGAAHVTFIDKSRDAIKLCRHNIIKMNEEAASQCICADASQLANCPHPFSLVFLDPPYFSKLIAPTLTRLAEHGWLSAGAIIVLEHDEKEAVALPNMYEKLTERRYGRAVIEVLKYSPLASESNGL